MKKWSKSCFGFSHLFSSIVFSTHILSLSTQKLKHIMVAFLYHMENMTVHISTAVSAKFAFGSTLISSTFVLLVLALSFFPLVVRDHFAYNNIDFFKTTRIICEVLSKG